ncbi:hypothetical protein V502_01978 [Pseudogymnoascus sp. VKM F-4520 (FW-2644)]|nr:hypothetical protein V502_01978 [Pseudogymnoascus sp. VKM F-4520 (FW-2644)]
MRLISATLRATVAVSALSSLGLAMILPTPGAIDTSLIRRDLLQEVIGVPDDQAVQDIYIGNGLKLSPYYADGSGVQSGNSVLTTLPTTNAKCWSEIFFVGTMGY